MNSEVELSDKLTLIARRLCPGWLTPTGHAHYCDVKKALKEAYEIGQAERPNVGRNIFFDFPLSQCVMNDEETSFAENNICPRCVMKLQIVGENDGMTFKHCKACSHMWVLKMELI